MALVLVIWAVSNSINFAFSSIFCLSKVSIQASSRHFLSDRSFKQGNWGIGSGIFLFPLANPPVVQSFLQSLLLMTSLPGIFRQSLLRRQAFPHCWYTGLLFLWHLAGGCHIPVGALVTSCNLAGGAAATFITSSLRAWLELSG
jgi:hypothetical protein